MKGEEHLKLRCKIWIESRHGTLIGKGGAKLLKSIKKKGSIREAAENIDWSYKFAWSYLKELEEKSPHSVIKTFKGGKQGGGTELTRWGEKLLALYEKTDKIITQKLVELEGEAKTGV